MVDNKYDVDTIKEALMVISFCEDDILDKIPSEVLRNMSDMAALSNENFYFDENKKLFEQNISPQCYELLKEIYFMYMEKY